jgi:hypothetical protein
MDTAQTRRRIFRRVKVMGLMDKIEMPLSIVLAEMELNGVAVDPDRLQELSKKTIKALAACTKKIYDLSGEEFNIASPIQLREVLFEKMNIPAEGIKKGKTGLSTSAEELEKLRGLHPIIDEISEFRELSKLQSQLDPNSSAGTAQFNTEQNQITKTESTLLNQSSGGSNTTTTQQTKPTITLIGIDGSSATGSDPNNPMNWKQGQIWQEPGAVSSDPTDGDLTAKIVISGNAVGTTGRGIGRSYAKAKLRIGLKIGDVVNPAIPGWDVLEKSQRDLLKQYETSAGVTVDWKALDERIAAWRESLVELRKLFENGGRLQER